MSISKETEFLQHLESTNSLRQYLKRKKVGFRANDNISEHLDENSISRIRASVEFHMENVLRSLLIDIDSDDNCKETAKRVAKMFVQETMAGRYEVPPTVTVFPNTKGLDELITIGPLVVESLCSHHLQNIRGVCYIGVLPSKTGNVPGLSKYSRRLKWLCRRPQIQEELTKQVADDLESIVGDNLGIGVVISAEHQCMSVRGVQEPNAFTTTSDLRGLLRDIGLKQEFLRFIELNRSMSCRGH